MYEVPSEYYFRIHHVRPRFKGDIENVLLFMAANIARIGEAKSDDFAKQLNSAIYNYPGNAIKAKKTINNWRTEISALFGFFIAKAGKTIPGRCALDLAAKEDLVAFFKQYLYLFQYPGAHVKPKSVLEQVKAGVHFKPAQYILKVLNEAERNTGNRIGLSKEEICHCIFNDLRCTAGLEKPMDTWRRIEENRKNKVTYNSKSDVIRYAGDIVDYMEIANLLVTHDSRYYYKNSLENIAILKFIKSTEWYNGYDTMISRRSASLKMVTDCTVGWYEFVNRDMANSDFETDILAFIATDTKEYKYLQKSRDNIYAQLLEKENITMKDIGDMGESLIHAHECQRIKNGDREDLIHLIKRIPTQLALGYDIQSVELDARKRYIEVKTTISSKPLHFNKIHLTPNEWSTATTIKDRYFIYRLMISKNEKKLYIIQDPVGLYKQNIVTMMLKDGAEITFDLKTAGSFEELLLWGN